MLVVVAVTIAPFAGIGVYWFLADLPEGTGPVQFVDQQVLAETPRRVTRIRLSEPDLGVISFVVSLPEPMPAGRLPVVLVLGGLGPGTKNIGPIPDAGNNAVVGYDWPLPYRLPGRVEWLHKMFEMRRLSLSTPGQVAAMIDWLAVQPWADTERISMLGFSLGTFAGPAGVRFAQERGHSVGWTVFAYGGAPVGAAAALHPGIKPAWIKPFVRVVVGLGLRPLEPTEHLPHLNTRFLLLGATEDRLIPRHLTDRFDAAVPEPKTVVRLSGDHIGLGQRRREFLKVVVAETETWLRAQGAVRSD